MGAIKKTLKKVTGAVGSVVGGLLGGDTKVNIPEVKTPAAAAERTSEVQAEDILAGTEDDLSTAKGKRALLRPASGSSLGGL